MVYLCEKRYLSITSGLFTTSKQKIAYLVYSSSSLWPDTFHPSSKIASSETNFVPAKEHRSTTFEKLSDL